MRGRTEAARVERYIAERSVEKNDLVSICRGQTRYVRKRFISVRERSANNPCVGHPCERREGQVQHLCRRVQGFCILGEKGVLPRRIEETSERGGEGEGR